MASRQIEPCIVQLRVRVAPLGDLIMQLPGFLLQRLQLLGAGLELTGHLHSLGMQALQALGEVRLDRARVLQRGVHVLLPGLGTDVLAQ